MNVLEELRGELESEPITVSGLGLVARALEWEMGSWSHGDIIGAPDPELHGRLLQEVAWMRAERELCEYAGRTLRDIMQRMGFAEDETQECVESIAVLRSEPDTEMVNIVYNAPPRVAAYMEAIATGDLLAADLLMAGGVVL